MRLTGALLSAAILAAPFAQAEPGDAPSPNIAGLWTFQAQLPNTCSFDGQARLAREQASGDYRCELTARQHCPSVAVTYVVEQTCKVAQDGASITIQSTIVNFLEGDPTPYYTPDHFKLTIDDPDTMSGKLIGTSIYPALWRRANGAIS